MPSPVPGLWGPDGCSAAVSITFDNLGEVTELERGTWPEGLPRGQHFSVIQVLPAILQMLDELALSATFFVEGLNVELYPRALQGIVEAGHELAYHSWQHEEWQHLGYQEERLCLLDGHPLLPYFPQQDDEMAGSPGSIMVQSSCYNEQRSTHGNASEGCSPVAR